jgi:hypothetical protein
MSRKVAGSVALEALLIVGSILLAFAIDAAWEGREERERERILLEALRSDLESNTEELSFGRRQHELYRAAAVEFLELATPGASSQEVSVPDSTLIRLVSWYTYDPALGSLNSAIASGQLYLIRDDRLRVALAGWVNSVEDLKELEVVDRGHAQRFADIAFEFVPFRSATFRMGMRGTLSRESTARSNDAGLLTSLRAENVAVNRVAEIGFILNDIDRLEQQLASILDLLVMSLE